MLHKDYYPDIRLSHIIETYWIESGFNNNQPTFKILPDGCVNIVFTFDTATGHLLSEIVGLMTAFVNISRQESAIMFGIRFKPAGLTAFTRMPLDSITNNSVEMSLAETLLGDIHKALPEKKSVEEVIDYMNNFFLGKLSALYSFDNHVIHAVSLISSTKGIISLSELSDRVCLSQRHLERKFKLAVGASPKTFAQLTRFKQALHYLQRHPRKDLLTIAVECGYYDHAHLIKDFKSFTGETPACFRRQNIENL
ncbi:MAG: helix-turn-helix domain-containing protein [Tannerellaceae bacterium]|jgi:AraC-like DNA-binding protein|nr:helix-turn-helix domain-containing protein [Tannerellaceae bacterium]